MAPSSRICCCLCSVYGRYSQLFSLVLHSCFLVVCTAFSCFAQLFSLVALLPMCFCWLLCSLGEAVQVGVCFWDQYERSKRWFRAAFLVAMGVPFAIYALLPLRSTVDFGLLEKALCAALPATLPATLQATLQATLPATLCCQ